MKLNCLLIGNLTIDHNRYDSKKYTGPGGSVYFCAKILENLGCRVTLVSPYGKDFPKSFLPKTIFYPSSANIERTLVFKNIYDLSGKRRQYVEQVNSAKIQLIDLIPKNLTSKFDLVIAAPILPNFNHQDLWTMAKKFTDAYLLLLPQGLFRKVDRNGKIAPFFWQTRQEIIDLFSLIIVSEEDYQTIDMEAEKWSRGEPMVIVTRAEKGCHVYVKKDRKIVIPAYCSKKLKNTTGAGDIFAASFSYNYLQTQDLLPSVKFAHASAYLSLRLGKKQLQYGYSDIFKLLNHEYFRK